MRSNWKDLQPIRVANGWTIDINNFYQFELNKENLDWYYGEFLLCGTHSQKKVCFDSSYEPEGDPEGFLTVRFYSMNLVGWKSINSLENLKRETRKNLSE